MAEKSILKNPIGLIKSNTALEAKRFLPLENAPFWLQGISKIALSEVACLALLEQTRLGLKIDSGIKFFSRFDPSVFYLCGLASRLRGTGKRIAIGLPPGARHLPLLLAVTVLIANTFDKNSTENASDGVLIVSPDLLIRSCYCDLFIEKIPLDEIHKGSRMLRNGKRGFLGKSIRLPKSQGVCFYLPPRNLPSEIDFHPNIIITDYRYGKWIKRVCNQAKWDIETFPKAGSLAIFSIGDNETRDALIKTGFEEFPIDQTAIQTCLKYVPGLLPQKQNRELLDFQLFPTISHLQRNHRIVQIKETVEVEKYFQSIQRLIESQGIVESPGLNMAKWLLSILCHIPTPLIWYEEAAKSLGQTTIRRLIDRLDYRNHADSVDPGVLQTIRVQFEQLYKIMENKNPRSFGFCQLVNECLNSKLLILVRDKIVERAVRNWLSLEVFSGDERINLIDIRSLSKYHEIVSTKFEVTIICGVIPRKYRWIQSGALGTKTIYQAYSHEIEVIRRQLLYFYDEHAIAKRSWKRNKYVEDLLNIPNSSGGREASIPKLKLEIPSIPCKVEDKKKNIVSLENLAEVYNAKIKMEEESRKIIDADNFWDSDDGDDIVKESIEVISNYPSHYDDVLCLKFRVYSKNEGQCYIWLNINNPIEVIQANKPIEVINLLPEDIQPGDIILIMDEGTRGDLFDRVVELVEQQPQLRYLAAYRKVWQGAIQILASKYREGYDINYSQMLRTLRGEGSPIQTELALKLWIRGQVIGPENPSSIKAVGIATGVMQLVNNAKEFDAVFRKIRGIRTSLGRLLNESIRHSFHNFAQYDNTSENFLLDNRLKLPISELIETIDFAEVQEINQQIERIPPQFIGHLYKVGEN